MATTDHAPVDDPLGGSRRGLGQLLAEAATAQKPRAGAEQRPLGVASDGLAGQCADDSAGHGAQDRVVRLAALVLVVLGRRRRS